MSKIKPLKYATVEQAIEAYNAGNFVYHNPCSNILCKKECSTPTKEIWVRRINEFGSIANMYNKYVCRKCRKHDASEPMIIAKDVVTKAAQPMPVAKAQEPLPRTIIANAPMMKAKVERPLIQIKPETQPRKPGDFLEPKPGEMAFSIWENGIYKGTAWHKTGEKIS